MSRKKSFACMKASAVLSPSLSDTESNLPPWMTRRRVTKEDTENIVCIWSACEKQAEGPPKQEVAPKVSFAVTGEAIRALPILPVWSAANTANDDTDSDSEYETCGRNEFGSVLHAVTKISRKWAPRRDEDVPEVNKMMLFEDDFISFACARETAGRARGKRYGGVKGFLAKVVSMF